MRNWKYERIIWHIEREWIEFSENESVQLRGADEYVLALDDAIADAGIKKGFIGRICHIIYIERLLRKVKKQLDNV